MQQGILVAERNIHTHIPREEKDTGSYKSAIVWSQSASSAWWVGPSVCDN